VTNQEFQEFYKKNKVAVIGVPIIIGILLLDMLVLKPGRRKKTEGTQLAVTTTTAEVAPVAGGPAADPLAPPAPLNVPVIPPLKAEVERRFLAVDTYPYPATKNIFLPPVKAEGPVVIAPTSSEKPLAPEVVQRPEVSYHGFFVIGEERVAILKQNQRVLLRPAGSRLPGTPYLLSAIALDRILLRDTTESGQEFEVLLSDAEKRVEPAQILREQAAKEQAATQRNRDSVEDHWITLRDTQATLGAYGVYFPPGRSLARKGSSR
jgi:hypothetical protein